MLSLSHLIIMIIFALIFLGPDRIPQFLKSCAEGIVGFKKIINNEDNLNEKTSKKNNKNFKSKKNNKNFKFKKNNKNKPYKTGKN